MNLHFERLALVQQNRKFLERELLAFVVDVVVGVDVQCDFIALETRRGFA